MEWWPQLGVEALWQITLMLQAMHAGLDGLLHLTNHSWPPEVLLTVTEYDRDPADLHPYGSHLRWQQWWALGTMKSRRSSVLPLGIDCRYKAPWWIIKSCQFCRISWPSSLEACSARSTFKSVFFCAFSQSKTALNIRSSLWALAQLVTCICTSV